MSVPRGFCRRYELIWFFREELSCNKTRSIKKIWFNRFERNWLNSNIRLFDWKFEANAKYIRASRRAGDCYNLLPHSPPKVPRNGHAATHAQLSDASCSSCTAHVTSYQAGWLSNSERNPWASFDYKYLATAIPFHSCQGFRTFEAWSFEVVPLVDLVICRFSC